MLNDTFGISHALMTTVHAYTNDQKILDQVHSDIRRARAAAANIIPNQPPAPPRPLALSCRKCRARFTAWPSACLSRQSHSIDLVANVERSVTRDDVNEAFQQASQETLSGVLEYCEEELVSSDFKGNPASAIFDAPSTMVMGDSMVKVLGWYDNELGL